MNCDNDLAKGMCKPLPNKSFAMVLSGKSGSGKTNLAISLLKDFSIVCNFVSIVEVKLASGPLRIRENSKLLLAL